MIMICHSCRQKGESFTLLHCVALYIYIYIPEEDKQLGEYNVNVDCDLFTPQSPS